MILSELKRFRRRIPRGGIKKIAERSGISYQVTCLCLRGKIAMKDEVLRESIKVMEEMKLEREEIIRKINTTL